jgi:hypothetical protein
VSSDLDLQSARLFIDQHGDDAEIHAAIQVDANRHEGDLEGQHNWLQLIEAIKVLRQIDAGAAEKMH